MYIYQVYPTLDRQLLYDHLTIDSINWSPPDEKFFVTSESTRPSVTRIQSISPSIFKSILSKSKNFHPLPPDGIIRTITPHRNNVLPTTPRSPVRLSAPAPSFLFRDKKRSLIFNLHLSYTSSHLTCLIYPTSSIYLVFCNISTALLSFESSFCLFLLVVYRSFFVPAISQSLLSFSRLIDRFYLSKNPIFLRFFSKSFSVFFRTYFDIEESNFGLIMINLSIFLWFLSKITYLCLLKDYIYLYRRTHQLFD